MNMRKIITRAAATATLGLALTGCSTTPATNATPELKPVPTMSAEDKAEAAEMWEIDTASDTPFHDDVDTTGVLTEEVPAPVMALPEPVLQVPENIEVTTPEVPVMSGVPVESVPLPEPEVVAAPITEAQSVIEPQPEVVIEQATESEVETTPEFIEVIWDEGQPTHWENGGLVIGTYSDALATCQDVRFTDESDGQNCINAATEWGKDTGQDMNVGPTTLPEHD